MGALKSKAAGFGAAILIPVLAALLRWALTGVLGTSSQYLFFFPAVFFVAWLGGLKPGLIATAISAALALKLFVIQVPTHPQLTLGDFIGLTAFSLSGIGFAWLQHVVSRSLTAQRAAEQQLRDSEKQFRDLIENLPLLAWSARPDGFIDYYNQRWFQFTGTTLAQMEGWGWKSVHDPARVDAVAARWAQAVASGEPFEMEFPLRRADGVFRWFLTRVSPLRDNTGKVLRWFGTNTDVTTLRDAEERLALLSEASSNFIAARLDLSTVLKTLVDSITPRLADSCAVVLESPQADSLTFAAWKHANPEAQQLMGEVGTASPLKRGEGISGRVIATGRPIVELVAKPGAIVSATKTAYGAFLERFPVSSILSVPLRSAERVLGALSVMLPPGVAGFDHEDQTLVQEIADRASAAIVAAQQYEQAERAIRLRDDFLLVASHELRTPLTALQLQLQSLSPIVAQTNADARVIKRLEAANRQTLRLGRLVDDLLDVSQLDADKLKLRPEHFDLMSLVQEVADRHATPTSPVTIEGAGPVWLIADASRIEQVLTNLVGNAIKYGPQKPVVIKVEEAEGKVTVSVRDEGMGIGPKDLKRIFGRFERAVPTQNYGGLGLGLFIARQIVEAHGGTIDVVSELGAGSTFTVRLPRK